MTGLLESTLSGLLIIVDPKNGEARCVQCGTGAVKVFVDKEKRKIGRCSCGAVIAHLS